MHAPLVIGRNAIYRVTDERFLRGGQQELICCQITCQEPAKPAASGILEEVDRRHIERL